jgi:hypothetical protein
VLAFAAVASLVVATACAQAREQVPAAHITARRCRPRGRLGRLRTRRGIRVPSAPPQPRSRRGLQRSLRRRTRGRELPVHVRPEHRARRASDRRARRAAGGNRRASDPHYLGTVRGWRRAGFNRLGSSGRATRTRSARRGRRETRTTQRSTSASNLSSDASCATARPTRPSIASNSRSVSRTPVSRTSTLRCGPIGTRLHTPTTRRHRLRS